MTELKFAPVQGHTDAAFRHFHASQYGALSDYFTPFIRLERGDIRKRDINDFTSPLNDNLSLIPQIIFRDEYELITLVNLLKQQGVKAIDLNMGCPFPLQTGHGRGAATISNEPLLQKIEETVKNNPDINFSVKMRLGLSEPDEWQKALPYLNKIRLSSLTVHPRVAKQQYSGDLFFDRFQQILEESKNPVVFNGEISHPKDISDIVDKFPGIAGVMSGRGILARPSLFKEYCEGEEWDKTKRLTEMLKFHRNLFNHYSEVLCGESQLIGKIKPFWEYAENEIGRKPWKNINKATNLARYQSAVASIEIS